MSSTRGATTDTTTLGDPERRRVVDHVRVMSLTWCGEDARLVTAAPSPAVAEQIRPFLPAREVMDYAGSRHTPGDYYSHTDDELLRYESWNECRWLRILDFDPHITYLVAQPLTIEGFDIEGTLTATPDIYAETRDGERLVIDPHVSELDMLDPKDAIRAARRARLVGATCEYLGWTYYPVETPPQPLAANTDFLADFARDIGYDPVRPTILQAAHRATTLSDLWKQLGMTLGNHPLVPSCTYHLLWTHELTFDRNERLSTQTIVRSTSDH
ncbi:TnsA-like heteromeric transposase endonuclease subunit [Nocardioides sp. URHA0020]|uniref:TnsA-like heteromeric transposase endonuclease subunit n=1 Tax=Nocardioides sp. URHA0020 TaxID=1380392 RepID=UPI0012DF3437|nr:TnsA-like heteromeric transposase endonuclease subunit [Nocardioides sp. URHA0020]